MTINNIYNFLDSKFNFMSQDEWDKSGGFNLNYDLDISKLIVSLDINNEIVDYAIKNNIKLIVSHHPIYIDENDTKIYSIKNLISKLKDNNINIISIHTNYDKYKKGMNYQIAKELNLINIQQLSDYLFIGKTSTKLTTFEFLKIVKDKLNLNYLIYDSNDKKVNNKKQRYLNVAISSGAGSSSLYLIKKKDKIDILLTGEVKWHLFDLAKSKDISIVDIGHIAEKVFIDDIKKIFNKINLEVISLSPTNDLKYI